MFVCSRLAGAQGGEGGRDGGAHEGGMKQDGGGWREIEKEDHRRREGGREGEREGWAEQNEGHVLMTVKISLEARHCFTCDSDCNCFTDKRVVETAVMKMF